ncbi:MAG: hypothetical protein ACREB6_02500 [Rhodospirillales bacterium]
MHMPDFGALGNSLIVAAASGLGYLAYKHPSVYDKLAKIFLVLGIIVFISASVWDTSRREAFSELSPLIKDGKSLAESLKVSETAQKMKEDGFILTGRFTAIWVVTMLYLSFLWILDPLISLHHKRQDKD